MYTWPDGGLVQVLSVEMAHEPATTRAVALPAAVVQTPVEVQAGAKAVLAVLLTQVGGPVLYAQAHVAADPLLTYMAMRHKKTHRPGRRPILGK